MAEGSKDSQIGNLLDTLVPQLLTPKTDLEVEIEMRLTALLGVEVGEAFRAVAARQQHTASSLNLDRVHRVVAGAHRSRAGGSDEPYP